MYRLDGMPIGKERRILLRGVETESAPYKLDLTPVKRLLNIYIYAYICLVLILFNYTFPITFSLTVNINIIHNT